MSLYRFALLFLQFIYRQTLAEFSSCNRESFTALNSSNCSIYYENSTTIYQHHHVIINNNTTFEEFASNSSTGTSAYSHQGVTKNNKLNNVRRTKKDLAFSTLLPHTERLLSRKKRFLLFPKGSNMKFTLQVSKSLIARFPRGINSVVESAVYYPLPTARIDLIPKRLRKPTTTTPKPTGTTPQIIVCIPGSLVCYKAKPATPPAKVQRIDENIDSVQWVEPTKNPLSFQHFQNYTNYYKNKYNKYTNYGSKYANYNNKFDNYKKDYDYNYANNQSSTQWSNHNKYRPNYQWQSTRKSPSIIYRPTPLSRWTKWTTEMPMNLYSDSFNGVHESKQYYKPSDNGQWSNKKKSRWYRDTDNILENDRKSEFFHPEDLDPYIDWPHYHSHRDRRQLFHHFEGLSGILGFNVKSCLVRAICESKRFLLPRGYSLLHDMVRLILTLPTINGMTDDYSRAMSADYKTCEAFLKPKCSINILEWILK